MNNIKSGKILSVSKHIWSKYSTVFVFIILFIICTLLTNGKFAEWKNITTIFRNSSTVGIIALGMTFVIISGGIDLSSGPVMATAGSVLVFLQKDGTPLVLAILACIAVAAAFGFINGIITTKVKVPPFIVTLAIGIIARSITMYIGNGATVTGNNQDTLFKSIGNGNLTITKEFIIPTPFIVMAVVAILLTILLVKTKFGTFVSAVGCNELAAKYSGIKVDRIKILTYIIAGICVGIAGTIEISRMVAVSSTTTGKGYEFDAITAVLVGGTSLAGGRGTIYGTVIGAIILFFVNNMMIQLDVSTYLTDAVKGAVILIAVLLQARNKN
jgi:ribose transport system permease protein